MKGEKYLFVVSGPSGTGKDTVVAKLLGSHPEIEKTVSATTRTMREGEVNGKNYHFLTKEQFETALAEGNIVEHTCYCENYYGTLRSTALYCLLISLIGFVFCYPKQLPDAENKDK